MPKFRKQILSLAGVGTALLASVCCTAPLLVAAGAVGMGVSQLTLLATLKPYLIALSLGLVSYGVFRSYRARNQTCGDPASPCADGPQRMDTLRSTKVIAWTAALVASFLIAFPYLNQNHAISGRSNTEIGDIPRRPADAVFLVKELKSECCLGAINYALKGVNGYLGVQGDYAGRKLMVWFDPLKTNGRKIEAAINDTPFKADRIQ